MAKKRAKTERHESIMTSDYSLFVVSKENRLYDPGKHKKLKEDFLRCGGFDRARPMVCFLLEDGKLEIVDGQHRFEAAKSLGMPVWYSLTKHRSAREFNTSAVPWSIWDWLLSWVRTGNQAAITLYNFVNKYGFSVTISEMLLAGAVGRGLGGSKVRSGTVQIKDKDYAEKVAKTILEICEVFPHAKDANFVTSVARFCRVPEFVPDQLVEKIKAQPGGLLRQPTAEAYSYALDKIYNRDAKRKRIPLKYLADEAMRKRNRAVNKLGGLKAA